MTADSRRLSFSIALRLISLPRTYPELPRKDSKCCPAGGPPNAHRHGLVNYTTPTNRPRTKPNHHNRTYPGSPNPHPPTPPHTTTPKTQHHNKTTKQHLSVLFLRLCTCSLRSRACSRLWGVASSGGEAGVCGCCLGLACLGLACSRLWGVGVVWGRWVKEFGKHCQCYCCQEF